MSKQQTFMVTQTPKMNVVHLTKKDNTQQKKKKKKKKKKKIYDEFD